jgi:hypothetical protein
MDRGRGEPRAVIKRYFEDYDSDDGRRIERVRRDMLEQDDLRC